MRNHKKWSMGLSIELSKRSCIPSIPSIPPIPRISIYESPSFPMLIQLLPRQTGKKRPPARYIRRYSPITIIQLPPPPPPPLSDNIFTRKQQKWHLLQGRQIRADLTYQLQLCSSSKRSRRENCWPMHWRCSRERKRHSLKFGLH